MVRAWPGRDTTGRNAVNPWPAPGQGSVIILNSRILQVARAVYARLDQPLRRRYWRVLALSGFSALTELVLASAVSLLGVVLASPESLLHSRPMRWLLDQIPAARPLFADQRQLLLWLLAGLCAAVAVKSVTLGLLTWRQASFGQAVGRFLGTRLFARLLFAPYLWHVRQNVSMLQARLSMCPYAASFMLAEQQLLSQLVVVVVLLGIILLLAPAVALLVCVCTGLCALATYRLTRRKVHQLNGVCVECQLDMGKATHPALYGIREITIYHQQDAFLGEYDSALKRLAGAQSLLPVIHSLPAWVLELVGMIMLLAAAVYMTVQGMAIGRLTGVLTLLAAVAWRLLPGMNRIVTFLLQLQQNLSYTQEVLALFDALPPRGDTARKAVPCPLDDALVLDAVSFRYPDTAPDRPDALQNLNLRIGRGSMVGLVGVSGAGKSTAVGLVTGLLEPTSGTLLVDGRPLTGAVRTGWQAALGYVPQSPFLLNASIAENVAFSQWHSGIDRERVLECCRMAAMDFLETLPHGIDTVIGERGVRLSGGQVQRVAIARALYAAPQMILFDEATSALDGAAEQAIQNTINSLSGQVTMLVVAHRLSTVARCDCIYWLEDGRIVMSGTPEQVLPAYEDFLRRRAATAGPEATPETGE